MKKKKILIFDFSQSTKSNFYFFILEVEVLKFEQTEYTNWWSGKTQTSLNSEQKDFAGLKD